MLELRKLLDKVDLLGQDAAERKLKYNKLARDARAELSEIAVDAALSEKIKATIQADSTWRGAEPLENTLDRRYRPQVAVDNVSLIGVDGSQIYPDRHGPVLYYLLNIGSIVLRVGSGEAPIVETEPQLFFREADLYERGQNLIGNEWINTRREVAEIRMLAHLAQAERRHRGGDVEQLVLAMKDGQLMMWLGERETTADKRQLLESYIAQLQTIQQAYAIPIGFVGRPRSANVVRLLWVARLQPDEITRERVQENGYRALTDRMLFSALLAPNQRSALFASTAKVNREDFKDVGQRICFFYMNVARSADVEDARIVRIDLPEWAARQPELVDKVQTAIFDDCEGTHFPYVLVRADELAVVTQQEKRDLDRFLSVAISNSTGMMPEASAKAIAKGQSRQYGTK